MLLRFQPLSSLRGRHLPRMAARWLSGLLIAPEDQPTIAVLLAILCVVLGVWSWTSDPTARNPIELERAPEHRLDYRIDLNRANWVEWAQLPGIGQVLGRRIVEHRDAHGPFRSIADLRRVKGIGRKKLEAIRPFLLAPAAEPSSPPDSEHSGQTSSS